MLKNLSDTPLGDDPDQPKYIQPEAEGVWAFVDAIAAWIAAPPDGLPIAP